MSRFNSILVAFVAVLLVILAVSAAATVPRCDQDGQRTDAGTFPAAVADRLTYNNVSTCDVAEAGSIEIVSRDGAPMALAKMGSWKYFIGMRADGETIYTLNAKCGEQVVCQAQVSYSASAM